MGLIKDILSILGSIASVIALPIAIWQIRQLRKDLKTSEKAAQLFHQMKEEEKIRSVIDTLKKEREKITSIRINFHKQGINMDHINDLAASIMITLDNCRDDLPDKYHEPRNCLDQSISNMHSFIQKNDQEKALNDASINISFAVGQLLKSIDELDSKKIQKIIMSKK